MSVTRRGFVVGASSATMLAGAAAHAQGKGKYDAGASDTEIKIGNTSETVVERSDFPPERLRSILGNETVAVLGYGVQGRGQSLNMKDNGVRVLIGQREKTRSWDLAAQDGWVPGQTLTDWYRLPLSADLPPGEYWLEIGAYQSVTTRRLPLLDEQGGSDRTSLLWGPIRIE